MERVVEAQVDTAMAQPLTVHALPYARFPEDLHGALLEDARADPRLHVLPATGFQDHRLDPLTVQELAEQQARRTGTDDRHLGALGHH